MTKGEFLQNRSTEAIIKTYDEIATDLIDDMEEAFGEEFYVDGSAPGNSKRVHGIESFMPGDPEPRQRRGDPDRQLRRPLVRPRRLRRRLEPRQPARLAQRARRHQYDFWSPGHRRLRRHPVLGDADLGRELRGRDRFGIIKSKKSKSAKGSSTSSSWTTRCTAPTSPRCGPRSGSSSSVRPTSRP
jgi:hypothetical protein